MKVTFDSNVWQPVCDPQRYLTDPSIAHFQKINSAISTGEINAYLAETTFTLEAIKKADRQATLANYKLKVALSGEELPNGTLKLNVQIGPDLSAHPGNNSHLALYLANAIPLGFKILYCPRIGAFKNFDVKDDYFVAQSEVDFHVRNELAGKVAREIEARNAGVSQLKAIGAKYSSAPRDWMDGIRIAPDDEEKAIAKAFAEWADGDSIAAHIGYGNTHYCTRDQGRSAGQHSILARPNRTWLEQTYKVVFVTPDELSALLV